MVVSGSILFVLLLLFAADRYVVSFSKDRLYTECDTVPHKRAALVLGCGKYVQGRPNLYYRYRIDAAAELWEAGKIDAIVVSGDNCRKGYDEPTSMKADLIERGVPAEYITIDYAGFRTLDSVVRAGAVFGLEDYIVVSQRFHCQRAIFLGQHHGQSVIGYCAGDVYGAAGFKMRLRESLARAKAVSDVLFKKSPKYLGEQEKVQYLERP